MCVVKKPKVTTEAQKEKPVQVFTNRYFANRGADAAQARVGRNALKIKRTSTQPSAPPAMIAPSNPTILTGVQSTAPSGMRAPTIPIGSGGFGGMAFSRSMRIPA